MNHQIRIIDTIKKKEFGSDDPEYLIYRVDPLDSLFENELFQQGFRLHERILYMTINLQTADLGEGLEGTQDITWQCDQDFSQEVYDLAYKVYVSDRRFHLDIVFDQEQAIPVMRSYIDRCRDKGMVIYKAKHKETLLGFTIVDHQVEDEKNCFENVLGVTAPGIRGKMIAAPLYRYMLRSEQGQFKKYVGRVSSANVASINLHYQLGAKVTMVYDEWIKKEHVD